MLAGAHQGIQSLVQLFYGFLSSQPANSTDAIPANITESAFNATVNKTIDLVLNETSKLNQTVTEEASKSFLQGLADTSVNIFNWGYTTVGYAGSGLKNALFAFSEGSLAAGRTAEIGNALVGVGKSAFVMTDAFGLYLFEIYMQYGPKVLGDILQQAQQKLKEQEKENSSHPQGWGVATLVLTFASLSLLTHCLHRLKTSQNQKEIKDINEWIEQLQRQANNQEHSMMGYLGSVLKYGALGATGFSFAAFLTLPLLACSGIALLTPGMVAVANWGWAKFTGNVKKDKQDILDLIEVAERMQEVMNKMSMNRELQKVMQSLAIRAASGDRQALEDMLRIMNKNPTHSPEDTLEDSQVPQVPQAPQAPQVPQLPQVTIVEAPASSLLTFSKASMAKNSKTDKEPAAKAPVPVTVPVPDQEKAATTMSKSARKRAAKKAKKNGPF